MLMQPRRENLATEFSFKKLSPAVWLKPAVYALLLFFVYRTTFGYLFEKWQSDDFTYCYIVPFITVYLIWEKRDKLASIRSVASWNGLIPLTIGILLFLVGELASEYTLQFLSFWLVMVGLCWLHLGREKLKAISFPLAFSLAMFVPPNAIYAPITLKLKLVSSQVGVKMMQCYGLSAYREGNVIDLGFTQLQVVDACSGLRYVIPLFVMGILVAYYYRAAMWKRVFVVFSTIPLSIFTNSLRIASVGILYQFWGPSVAEGFFHDFSGWFIFMASLAFLLGEMWVLKKLFKEPAPKTKEVVVDTVEGSECEGGKGHIAGEPPAFSAKTLFSPQFIAALVLLLATVAAARTAATGEKVPLARPFIDFPLRLSDWTGAGTQLDRQFLDELKLSDYVMIDYRNPVGQEVNFYVAYYKSQSKGEATHSPATCLPSSGWVFNESGTVPLNLAGGKTLQVSRAFMEKNGVKQLVYFWFPQRGRVLNNIYEIKLYNFLDALTRHRTDGALVRVMTPVYENDAPGSAEQRLQRFAQAVVPVLDGYLPK
jgi:exosortase D (VPLPA-CTERM-specific)